MLKFSGSILLIAAVRMHLHRSVEFPILLPLGQRVFIKCKNPPPSAKFNSFSYTTLRNSRTQNNYSKKAGDKMSLQVLWMQFGPCSAWVAEF